jgi:hypothetical protein
MSKAGERTLLKIPRIHHTRADAEEEHPFGTELGAEFGNRHVESDLAYRVNGGSGQIEIGDKLDVCMAARDGDDLLRCAAENQGNEEVKEMDLRDGVGFEVGEQVLFEGYWVFAPGLGNCPLGCVDAQCG